MEELEIFNAQTQGYVANGLFQIAVIIGVFIVFRAARALPVRTTSSPKGWCRCSV